MSLGLFSLTGLERHASAAGAGVQRRSAHAKTSRRAASKRARAARKANR